MAASKRRSLWITLTIPVVSVVAALLFTSTYQVLELKILDAMFRLRGPVEAEESPIVLLAISDQADKAMPLRWPWPREYYGRVIENLNEAGAKVIGIDVTLDKPDRLHPESDSMFAEILRKYPNVVLAGNVRRETRHTNDGGIGATGTMTQLDPPYALFDKARQHPWGFIGVTPDEDGVLRKYLLSQDFGGNQYYPLGVEVLRKYLGDNIQVKDSAGFMIVGPHRVRKASGGRSMMINYQGGPGAFKQFSFDQVVDDADFQTADEIEMEMDENWFDDPTSGLKYTDAFRDKIVLIGSTMLELHDFYATPFSPNGDHPGYEAHANAIQTILSGKYIVDIDPRLTLFSGLLISFVLVVLAGRSSVFIHLPLVIVIFLGWLGAAIYGFVAKGFYIESISPLATIGFSYVGAVIYDYVVESKEKKRIKNMFSSYVSPQLVDKMVDSGEEPKLGGEEVEITAFFSDIASFSTFSEILTPVQLVDLINEYLSAMTDILTDQQGTLDKYIGDAVVAFYNAPAPVPDHAYRAVLTSQLMHLKMQELRKKWKDEGDKWPYLVSEMVMRVGLNSGPAVTGNMGSTRRFNYTMMGDTVNLAARCESGAKAYGVFTMITGATKEAAEKHGNDILYRYLDKIVVKGRTLPVEMWEAVGLKNATTQKTFDCIGVYERGIEAYLKQEWDTAEGFFKQSAILEPWQPGHFKTIKENPSLAMIERVHQMRQHPPGPDWNGVYVMTSK
jgi:adenylate cyclase